MRFSGRGGGCRTGRRGRKRNGGARARSPVVAVSANRYCVPAKSDGPVDGTAPDLRGRSVYSRNDRIKHTARTRGPEWQWVGREPAGSGPVPPRRNFSYGRNVRTEPRLFYRHVEKRRPGNLRNYTMHNRSYHKIVNPFLSLYFFYCSDQYVNT